MEMTQVATNIGTTDNACGTCSLLSSMAQQRVADLLKQLRSELGDSIWCMPPNALHVTLCEIFQAKPYQEDKELLFERNRARYESTMKTVLNGIKPIKVAFNRIEASAQGIIIRGSDDHAFDTIRVRLTKLLPLPAESKQPPTIVHSSIARYRKELDLNIVKSVIAKLNISFTETITEFQLMHNVSPHMLHYEVAARYPLRAK